MDRSQVEPDSEIKMCSRARARGRGCISGGTSSARVLMRIWGVILG